MLKKQHFLPKFVIFQKLFILRDCSQICPFIRFFVLKNLNISISDAIQHFRCVYSEFWPLMYYQHFLLLKSTIFSKSFFEWLDLSSNVWVGQKVASTLSQIVNIYSNTKKTAFFASKPHPAFERKSTNRPESKMNLLHFWNYIDF